MAIDLDNILFDVTENGEVKLFYGPLSVVVCNDPHDFEDFKDKLIDKLQNIDGEIKDDYLNGD